MDDAEPELQALLAMYGEDCRVLQKSPVHVEILLKPRTANEMSQQFVEIVLSIKTNETYPGDTPAIEVVVAKGLDIVRQGDLLSTLRAKADQLRNEPMLVILSESAVEFLTANNYPEGECCFCLLPLLDTALPHHQQQFMKLMSCFHCFHSDCSSSWWRWLSQEYGVETVACPICRTAIHTEDLVRIRDVPLTQVLKRQDEEDEAAFALLLQNDSERQAQYKRNFQAQLTRGGVIEQRRLVSIVPMDDQLVVEGPSAGSDGGSDGRPVEDPESIPTRSVVQLPPTSEPLAESIPTRSAVRLPPTSEPSAEAAKLMRNNRSYQRRGGTSKRAWIRKQPPKNL